MTKSSLDWQECLRLSNNKEDLAKELLEMLKKDLPSFQAGINQALKTNNIQQLQNHTHKLHGACCYCGVPRLKQLAEQLESQIKTHKNDQLASLVKKVDQEIQNVLTALKQHEF